MRYSLIREMDISNGCGVGISLFVQGCHFHCQGCFNQETWDFNGGHEWTKEVEDRFVELANRPYIQRITILGGEPLADENVNDVLYLIARLKCVYPDKKVWLYTGYTWEDIVEKKYSNSNARLCASILSDVIVDGQFQFDKQDINHKQVLWAGSTNQRVIDARKSFVSNSIVLYEG